MQDPDSESDEDEGGLGGLRGFGGGGGGGYVVMRGAGGNHIRIPRSLLMRLLNMENDEEEEDSN